MIGVVILNYNSSKLTENLCKSLENIEKINKIIIVDNMSTDNSRDRLKKILNRKIDFVFANENKGYACGNNLGIKYILKNFKEIKSIAILNPDIEISNINIFDLLQKELDKDKELGIISPFMKMNGQEKRQLNYWKSPQKFDNLFLILGLTNRLYKNLLYKEEVIPGSFLYFNIETIKTIDYFDEGTFLYQEENILYQKLKKIGKKMKIIETIDYNHNHDHKPKTFESENYHNKILFDSTIYYEKKYNQKYSKFNIRVLNILFRIRKVEIFMKHSIKKLKK
ncbi:glycosyltransferase [Cetobacterium sp.]|uniref:glycosyltransferase n=1 Tax=Cetobacterium sp. TaxID=2071632 RepID=UPI003F3B4FE6